MAQKSTKAAPERNVSAAKPGRRRNWLRDNGLTLALMGVFVVSLIGQAVTGWRADIAERAEHGEAVLALMPYLGGGEFLSALFENWESEFLQMWAYVVFTAYLFQRGSPESRDPDQPEDTTGSSRPDSPWPARVGGWVAKVYAHSLGLALALLFIVSFVMHWLNSARAAVDEAQAHHQPVTPLLAYIGDPRFWFESLQNWQSEFLSAAVLIVLSIFLRERGSPESKKVDDPHAKTGGD